MSGKSSRNTGLQISSLTWRIVPLVRALLDPLGVHEGVTVEQQDRRVVARAGKVTVSVPTGLRDQCAAYAPFRFFATRRASLAGALARGDEQEVERASRDLVAGHTRSRHKLLYTFCAVHSWVQLACRLDWVSGRATSLYQSYGPGGYVLAGRSINPRAATMTAGDRYAPAPWRRFSFSRIARDLGVRHDDPMVRRRLELAWSLLEHMHVRVEDAVSSGTRVLELTGLIERVRGDSGESIVSRTHNFDGNRGGEFEVWRVPEAYRSYFQPRAGEHGSFINVPTNLFALSDRAFLSGLYVLGRRHHGDTVRLGTLCKYGALRLHHDEPSHRVIARVRSILDELRGALGVSVDLSTARARRPRLTRMPGRPVQEEPSKRAEPDTSGFDPTPRTTRDALLCNTSCGLVWSPPPPRRT